MTDKEKTCVNLTYHICFFLLAKKKSNLQLKGIYTREYKEDLLGFNHTMEMTLTIDLKTD